MVAEYWWNTKIFFQEILLIRFVRNILFWKRNKKVLEDRDSRSCRHVSWFLLHHRETGGVIAHFQPTSSGKPSSISLFSSPGRGLCDLWYFWCYLVDKFPTDGSEANCQPNFKQLQVVSLGGQMLVEMEWTLNVWNFDLFPSAYWWNANILFQEILLIRFVRNILFWKRTKTNLVDRDSRSYRHVSWFWLHHRETGWKYS